MKSVFHSKLVRKSKYTSKRYVVVTGPRVGTGIRVGIGIRVGTGIRVGLTLPQSRLRGSTQFSVFSVRCVYITLLVTVSNGELPLHLGS
jgi:hypothetical protein